MKYIFEHSRNFDFDLYKTVSSIKNDNITLTAVFKYPFRNIQLLDQTKLSTYSNSEIFKYTLFDQANVDKPANTIDSELILSEFFNIIIDYISQYNPIGIVWTPVYFNDINKNLNLLNVHIEFLNSKEDELNSIGYKLNTGIYGYGLDCIYLNKI